jgi:hypothetical protein
MLPAGSGGGGQAGKSRGSNTNLNFERHVPKFLQPYAHLLGQKRQDEDEPQVVAAQRAMQDQEDDDEEDKAAEQVSRWREGPWGAAGRHWWTAARACFTGRTATGSCIVLNPIDADATLLMLESSSW